MRYVADGWQLNGIVTLASGRPTRQPDHPCCFRSHTGLGEHSIHQHNRRSQRREYTRSLPAGGQPLHTCYLSRRSAAHESNPAVYGKSEGLSQFRSFQHQQQLVAHKPCNAGVYRHERCASGDSNRIWLWPGRRRFSRWHAGAETSGQRTCDILREQRERQRTSARQFRSKSATMAQNYTVCDDANRVFAPLRNWIFSPKLNNFPKIA